MLTLFCIIVEYRIQHMPRPSIDIAVRLAIIRCPQFIPLREPLLKVVFWERSVNARTRPSLIARMNAIVFAHVLCDRCEHHAYMTYSAIARFTSTIIAFRPEGRRASSNVTWCVRIARVRGLVYNFSGRGIPKRRSPSQAAWAFWACCSPSGVSRGSAMEWRVGQIVCRGPTRHERRTSPGDFVIAIQLCPVSDPIIKGEAILPESTTHSHHLWRTPCRTKRQTMDKPGSLARSLDDPPWYHALPRPRYLDTR